MRCLHVRAFWSVLEHLLLRHGVKLHQLVQRQHVMGCAGLQHMQQPL